MSDLDFFEQGFSGNEDYSRHEDGEEREEGEEGYLETYEPNLSQVLALHKSQPNTLWTVIDGEDNDNIYIIAGFHPSQAIHYFVSNEPWQSDNERYLWMQSDYEE